jgi:hypothetical protein
MRKFARSIWVSFGNQDVTLSDKWGQADVRVKTQYYTAMNKRFPELLLCELDWKADQLAAEMYSGWRTQWIAKLARVSLAKGLGPPKRSRSEVLVSSNSIHLRRYISPTYSTLNYLFLALWIIKVTLLVLSLSPSFSLGILVTIFNSPMPSPGLNQI